MNIATYSLIIFVGEFTIESIKANPTVTLQMHCRHVVLKDKESE